MASSPHEKDHAQNGNGERSRGSEVAVGYSLSLRIAERNEEKGAQNVGKTMLDARPFGVIGGQRKRGGEEQHQRSLPEMADQQFRQTGEKDAGHDEGPSVLFAHGLHRKGVHVMRMHDGRRGHASGFGRRRSRQRGRGRRTIGAYRDGVGVDAHGRMAGLPSSQVQRRN